MKKRNYQRKTYAYYSSVAPASVEWLWYPYIPYGKLTLLEGDPGAGKSSFMLGVAALLSRGLDMPDGFHTTSPQNIVYQCSEDDIADTIKPRLLAANADCERIAYIIDDDGTLNMEDNRLDHTLNATAARLLILDPLQSFLPQNGDLVNAGQIRTVLSSLASLAAKYRCAIVMIGHMNKTSGSKNLYRGLGSIDIAAICRSVMMIMQDSDNEDCRYMIHVKSSLAPKGDAMRFEFANSCGVHWLGKYHIPIDTQENLPSRKPFKYNTAIEDLEALLFDGTMPSKEIMDIMISRGYSERTIGNAKRMLGVLSCKKGNSWYWSLPDIIPANSEVKHSHEGKVPQ